MSKYDDLCRRLLGKSVGQNVGPGVFLFEGAEEAIRELEAALEAVTLDRDGLRDSNNLLTSAAEAALKLAEQAEARAKACEEDAKRRDSK